MLKNYFTIAIRNFWKQKVFSLINVSGLAIGISAALVIYLLVQFEFSFEKFRKDNDRIYRVTTNITFPGESLFRNSGVPMPMPKALRSDLTGIETTTHFVTTYDAKVSIPVQEVNPRQNSESRQMLFMQMNFIFHCLSMIGWQDLNKRH